MNSELLLFQKAMVKAVRAAIHRMRNDGVVGVGDDCLWQCTVTHLDRSNGPSGTNAGWVARQVFDEVVTMPPFNRFVYPQNQQPATR